MTATPATAASAPTTDPRPPRRFTATWIEMLISSVIGLIASLVLSIDAWVLAGNPGASFSCDVSSTISCSKVAETWQAQLLGFPNAFLGLIFEPIVITFAVAGLARVVFPRWYMLGVQLLYTIAVAFAYWLFFQAYFVIGALCPWCLTITVTTLLVFTSMTRINILSGNFGEGVRRSLAKPLQYNVDIYATVLFLTVLAAMVIVRYA